MPQETGAFRMILEIQANPLLLKKKTDHAKSAGFERTEKNGKERRWQCPERKRTEKNEVQSAH